MSKRTKEEIDEAIARMRAEKPHIPEYNAFGENNHEKIEAAIKALQEGWDYMDNLEKIQEEEGWEDSVIDMVNDAINFNEGYEEMDVLLWYPETDYRKVAAPEEAPVVDMLAPPGVGADFSDIVKRDSISMTKKVNLCNAKTCNDCPFSNKSMRGFLADYKVSDFEQYQKGELSFPCHKHMTGGDMSALEAHIRVNNGEMPLCRGYVESFIKSGKVAEKNPTLAEAINMVKEQGLSNNTMSMDEFKEFHDIEKLFVKKI